LFNSNAQYAELNRLHQRANSGARWFYWIAALSLVNSIAYLSGSNWAFMIGLGSTTLVNGIIGSKDLGSAGKVIAFIFDVFAAGVFAGLGFLASKRLLWAYLVGIVLFALDTLLLFIRQDWIGIAFHVFAIYCIFLGFSASRKLLALQREAELATAADAGSGATTPAPEST
jgi:hypothetical protein